MHILFAYEGKNPKDFEKRFSRNRYKKDQKTHSISLREIKIYDVRCSRKIRDDVMADILSFHHRSMPGEGMKNKSKGKLPFGRINRLFYAFLKYISGYQMFDSDTIKPSNYMTNYRLNGITQVIGEKIEPIDQMGREVGIDR